ncbi:cupin domain-containing protein [Streptomyces sp. SP18BB07]|uniref:cupin domain-containing protein n=1 Tax=Streptomyces sp. SP18BB07 TaxID=3002522 RepID=UPI002E76C2A2|nr:cupin domain-containing protein [Streptomyces sp. SP18BB07]MEE1762862.1 cupin domain-containing protein [Streptomyces sp. SP18BB07]
MTALRDGASPVSLIAEEGPDQPPVTPALEDLYRGFEQALLVPLWTRIGDLMPEHPRSKARPHRWEWKTLLDLAGRSGDLVPVGRGGERRAMALANPSLGGRPYATPTLWAAIQYLMPGEDAPEHRHSQNAFRFVVEGEGVWTVVEGDPVPMRRGDFLPQTGMHWHAHHNATDRPMAWIDGLDIPFQYGIEAQFFDFGRDRLSDEEHATPDRSRSERLWGHPGLVPVSQLGRGEGTPLLCHRWADTDAALTDQLELERAGHPGTVEPGHALVRYTDPTHGGDVLPTIRAQFHRIRSGAETAPRRETGSSVYQVFDGSGQVTAGGLSWSVTRGDLFVVPSWTPLSIRSQASPSDSDSGALDLFQFSDAPIFTKLDLFRTHTEETLA